MKKKMKIIFIFTCITMASLALNVTVFGYSMPEKIRVGIEYGNKEVDQVTIVNSTIEIGMDYKDEFYSEAELSSKNGFLIAMPTEKTIDVNEFYGNYDDAYSACEDIKDDWGYDAVPAYTGRKLWGVYICDVPSDEVKFVAGDVDGKVLSGASSLMVLKDGNKNKMAFNGINPQIAYTGGNKTISLKSRSYRGVMEFGRYNGNKITAVNVLSLDEYLYGVVPSEMPSSWEKEALKAQSVAARCYAVTRATNHLKDGYEVCDSTNCQVYIGFGNEKQSTNNAVDETSGVGAYYDGKVINAVFCSSSGGATDDALNVWGGDTPYLKGVKEINEDGVKEWTRTYTTAEMGKILLAKGINIGEITDMEITSATKYGRVQEVTITGTTGKKVLKKEETRTMFSGTAEGSLPSRMYTINGIGGGNATDKVVDKVTDKGSTTGTIYVKSKDGAGKIDLSDVKVLGRGKETINGSSVTTPYAIDRGGDASKIKSATVSSVASTTYNAASGVFTIVGKGNGHGVGMSQYGANGMAKEGYTYDEILKHYYTGVTVK